MSHSSDRGQTEPLAALAAVVVVGLGLGLYAGVLDAKLPGSPDRKLSESVIERVESTVAPAAVALPSRIDESQAAGPDGYRMNVTLGAVDQYWTIGPFAPEGADTSTARIGVRVGTSKIRTGTLRVSVWT